MQNGRIKYLSLILIILLTVWVLSCSGRSGKIREIPAEKITDEKVEAEIKLIRIITPEENMKFKSGDPVEVNLATPTIGPSPDSVLIFYDGRIVTNLKSEPWKYSIPGSFSVSTGKKSVKATAFRNGRPVTSATRFVVILSDIIPERHDYKVINFYPHDRSAFTQGLFYDDGFLYEGTGQETGSTLREVELSTGKVIRQLNLSPELFGEGITLYKDRIYQVTWRSKVGFIYDKTTFRQINKFYYQSEGWGLTTMNDHIVMSDGTNILYIIEPEMFTVVTRLEVYDNVNMIDQLNELEYINGEIWANIWNSDLIARIDPVSGKLLSYVDLKGILKDQDTDTSINVLNGIAFDKEGGRIFVTGKNWPKLFEIKVKE
ncbi:MAG TPA: glutamine cyclotransferase [Bacteroidales bacterium]|nr:glutamine cyclotransferase [Bacteroidales bacterium]